MKTVLTLAFLLLASFASAQTQATPNSNYVWDQDAVDLATAQAYVYTAYVDALPPTVISTVACTGATSPFLCSGKVGSLPQGNHTVQLTAQSIAGESLKSSPLSFVFVVIPNPPRNPRIVGK